MLLEGEGEMSEEEEEVVNVGRVSLSRSGKSLTIMVMNQMFFVPLRDLREVLNGERGRVDVKQWVKRGNRGALKKWAKASDSRRRKRKR
jgi:hypothetical protein